MTHSIILPTALAALTLLGCGEPQVDTMYRGESLLQVSGRIETTEGVALTDNVTPVVLWHGGIYKGDFERMRTQEVSVSGTFPAQFVLKVFEPPPAPVLEFPSIPRVPGLEDEPAITFGYLGAIAADHDEVVYLGYERNAVTETCEHDDQGEITGCESRYCDYYEQCWTEWTDADGEVIEATNQLSVRNGLGILQGFVKDHAIMYLDAPAKPGSLAALRLGVKQLSAGYHLVRWDFSSDEGDGPAYDETEQDCQAKALAQAAALFEEAFGVKVEDLEGDDDRRGLALAVYEAQANKELGCTAGWRLGLEVLDASRDVTMQLGGELQTGGD